MGRVPFTLRIDEEERSALESLSEIEGRPINQLLNEAIKSYLRRQGHNERKLEANLASLQAYRKRDPRFKNAIAAFVEAEATLKDPVEGGPICGSSNDKPAGPIQRRIRDILSG